MIGKRTERLLQRPKGGFDCETTRIEPDDHFRSQCLVGTEFMLTSPLSNYKLLDTASFMFHLQYLLFSPSSFWSRKTQICISLSGSSPKTSDTILLFGRFLVRNWLRFGHDPAF
jgi:hypothetical protein